MSLRRLLFRSCALMLCCGPAACAWVIDADFGPGSLRPDGTDGEAPLDASCLGCAPGVEDGGPKDVSLEAGPTVDAGPRTGSWTAQVIPSAGALLHVWGSGPNDVYVVGEAGVILHSMGDGTWTKQTSGTTNDLNAVWGAAASDVYAVGSTGALTRSAGTGVWTASTHPDSMTYGAGIWGAAGSIFVVGFAATNSVQRYIGRPVGSETWSGVAALPGSLVGVWGSGPDDVYAVGVSNKKGSLLHYAGSGAWTEQDPSTTQLLFNVWGSGSNDVYAVGANGTILHSTGTGSWTKQATGTNVNWFDVWGSSANDVYVVGQEGTIYHSSGDGTWSVEPNDAAPAFHGVWGSSRSDVYAVGGSLGRGIIYRYH